VPLRRDNLEWLEASRLAALARDQEITQARAIAIARMAVRDNALALYRLGRPQSLL